MRTTLRSLGLAGGAVAAAVTFGLASPLPSMVQLLATTALIMGGTEHPLVQSNHDGVSNDPLTADEQWVRDYLDAMQDNYLEPTEGDRDAESNEPYRLVAVYTPEEFFPVVGSKTFDDSVAEGADNLDGCMTTGCDSHVVTEPDPGVNDEWVIVGYSQSARIASMEKQRLIDEYRDEWIAGDETEDISFLLLSNPNRPNGGVLMRFHGLSIPFLGVTMDGATPTDSCVGDTCHLPTVDVAQQYDALGGDFPLYPLNLLATLNSLAAYLMLHGDMPYAGMDEVDEDQGQFGDTHYYMVGADILPLLMPLEQLGVPRALLRVIDAPLRVLIETAYRRDISPGEPVPAQLVPVINPVSLLVNLLASIPVGIDDGIEEATGERPLGTQPAGIYGVGGEDEDLEGAPVGFIPLGKPDPTTSTEVEPAETGSLTAGTEIAGDEPPTAQSALPAAASTPETPKPEVPKAEEEPRSNGNLHTFFRERDNTGDEQENPKPRSERRPGSHLRNFVKRLTGQRPERSNTGTAPESGDAKTDDPSKSADNKDAAA
ncbi:PE-PPE domain-containing protein [Mycobacterium hippophais]|uniref:PE-PPE domain-containing protein n=1 Tax=Mycobacterium hippophais TaxID=3016340 RepID=UPI0022B8A1C9|nr:PE-PPE domain-containing protein [Mycobacterium hippophais]